jgi:hypothetical protein
VSSFLSKTDKLWVDKSLIETLSFEKLAQNWYPSSVQQVPSVVINNNANNNTHSHSFKKSDSSQERKLVRTKYGEKIPLGVTKTIYGIKDGQNIVVVGLYKNGEIIPDSSRYSVSHRGHITGLMETQKKNSQDYSSTANWLTALSILSGLCGLGTLYSIS